MAKLAAPSPLAGHARRLYIDELVKGLAGVVSQIQIDARELLDRPAEYLTSQRRRDLVQGLRKHAPTWQAKIVAGFQPVMSTYKGLVSDDEITALIEFIKSLK